jgi:hypothetical protein
MDKVQRPNNSAFFFFKKLFHFYKFFSSHISACMGVLWGRGVETAVLLLGLVCCAVPFMRYCIVALVFYDWWTGEWLGTEEKCTLLPEIEP